MSRDATSETAMFSNRDPVADLLALFAEGRWPRAAVVGDSNTGPLYADAVGAALKGVVDVVRADVPAGDSHKNRDTKRHLEDQLLDAGLGRDDVIVAVGGGVVSDLAGFVAATYKRGVDWIVVPTTLLAQVDASIGGKTGVNTPHGKNLVGAFHPPMAIVQHVAALATLPPLEVRNGLAECVKHAVIADAELFGDLEALARTGGRLPDEALVGRCAAVKIAVVERDPLERGLRRTLNFGHTVGHGIEKARGLPHGSAVAVGMGVEGALAAARGLWDVNELARMCTLLRDLGLPTTPEGPFDAIRPYLSADKKNIGGAIHCVMPARLGATHPFDGLWTTAVSDDELREAWRSLEVP